MMILRKGKTRPTGSVSPDGKRKKNSKGEWVPIKNVSGKASEKDTNTSRKSTLEFVPSDRFKASQWASQWDSSELTVNMVLEHIENKAVLNKIKETENKLKTVTPTTEKYRVSGKGASAVYTKERTAIHSEIIGKILSEKAIQSATPVNGSKPVFIMLGGRGGCLSADHEFLTRNGWKPISEYNQDDDVLVFDTKRNTTKFESPARYINLPCETFHHIKARGVDMVVSGEHTILHYKKFNPEKWRTISADDLVKSNEELKDGWDGMIPCSFDAPVNTEGVDLSDADLRVMVAVCADGSFALSTTKRCRISVRKQRKKDRLELLLNEARIKYKTYTNKKRPTEVRYSFDAPENNKMLAAYWKASAKQLQIIADEVIQWDGWTDKYKAWVFSSTKKEDIDFISYVFNTQGRRSSFYKDEREGTGWSPIWRVSAGVNTGSAGIRDGGENTGITTVPSVDGRKYCFTVSTGFFITRRNDCICITGNSGKSWLKGSVYAPDKCIVLDADEVKGMLKEYEGWNAFEVHAESSDIIKKMTAISKELGLNIVVDATMRQTKNAVGTAQDFKEAGYRVECHYMHLSRAKASVRAVSRFAGATGRYVPIDAILANTTNEMSFDAVKKFADAWSFRDNSSAPPPNLISQMGKGYFEKKSLIIGKNK